MANTLAFSEGHLVEEKINNGVGKGHIMNTYSTNANTPTYRALLQRELGRYFYHLASELARLAGKPIGE